MAETQNPPGPIGLRARLASLPEAWVQLGRFAIVGGLGTVTNLVLFFLLVDFASLDPLLGNVLCFGIAVSQNYVLNELWTFATEGDGALSWQRYAKFIAASGVGFVVNLVVLAGLLSAFDFPLKVFPQAIGIAAGTAVNFLASRHLVFRRTGS